MPPIIECVICGADTGLSPEDLETCNPVCSEECNEQYIKRS